MTINKIKYKDVFVKVTCCGEYTFKCFICDRIIKEESYYVDLFDRIIHNGRNKINSDRLRVCLTCVRTPIQVEKIIIPLLKILYGGEVIVIRLCCEKEKCYGSGRRVSKAFYY